jgi:putative Holliday junction resolvase
MNMENMKNYLGVDWGEKRIGIASADSETRLALPLKTVATLAELLAVMDEEKIDVVVLGAPQKMSGATADNPAWQNFLTRLKEQGGRPVELVDERLSSLAADSLAGKKTEKAGRDEIAATLILQNYLDRNVN